MQLTFKNNLILGTKNFVDGLKINNGKVNRSRFRLSQILSARLTELEAERFNMAEEYCKLDASGQLKSNKQGNMIFKSDEAEVTYRNLYGEMMKEDSNITVDDYIDKLKVLFDYLNEYDQELSGSDGFLFGLLMDELEKVGK